MPSNLTSKTFFSTLKSVEPMILWKLPPLLEHPATIIIDFQCSWHQQQCSKSKTSVDSYHRLSSKVEIIFSLLIQMQEILLSTIVNIQPSLRHSSDTSVVTSRMNVTYSLKVHINRSCHLICKSYHIFHLNQLGEVRDGVCVRKASRRGWEDLLRELDCSLLDFFNRCRQGLQVLDYYILFSFIFFPHFVISLAAFEKVIEALRFASRQGSMN